MLSNFHIDRNFLPEIVKSLYSHCAKTILTQTQNEKYPFDSFVNTDAILGSSNKYYGFLYVLTQKMINEAL